MAARLRRCVRCGATAPTPRFVLVDDGMPVRQHGRLRRRCPNPECRHEGAARLFAVVSRITVPAVRRR